MLTRRLLRVLLAVAVVIAGGVIGYHVIEGWSLFDALYMTIITIASVGFMEIHHLSLAGRVFTIFLIVGGVGTLALGFTTLTAFVVEGELTNVLRRRKMQKSIDQLNGHYVVCGAGRTAHYVIDELSKTNKRFVVIEVDPEPIKYLEDMGFLCILGDATQDAVLLSAGVERAAGLVTCLQSDADNLFVTLSAKVMNPGLRIIAKAVQEESEAKLRRAGADGVVMPHSIGGLRIASELIRPSVTTFLDVMLRSKDTTIRVDEIVIAPGSRLDGKALDNSGMYEVEGVTLVAMKDDRGGYLFNPSRHTVLAPGCVLIVMGPVQRIDHLRALSQASGKPVVV